MNKAPKKPAKPPNNGGGTFKRVPPKSGPGQYKPPAIDNPHQFPSRQASNKKK